MTFCLFVLRIGKSSEEWGVAYGIVTPAQEKMEKPVISESTQIGTFSGGRLSIRKVILSEEQDAILGIYDDLAHGVSLKTSFDKWGIDTSKLVFDVKYTQIAIQEPWVAEQILTNQLSYSKSICMLNPLRLFEKEGQIPTDSDKALKQLEKYLANQTKLPFGERYDHAGNLDIIVAPDRDAMGRPLVETHWENSHPFVQYVKLHKDLLMINDVLLINIICKQDSRIIKDSIEETTISEIRDVEREYSMDNCPDSIEIKIWRIRSNVSMVISNTVHYFVKQININMGVMEGEMRISTKWLDDIRESLPVKRKADADNASIIDRSEQIRTVIGEPGRRRVRRKKQNKSNDEFFPKGWNAEEEEHGLLSFLDWFKKKAKEAKHIFLQDPYFEDVALFFLASVDISSEYTILTQTQLKTNPDGTIKVDDTDDKEARKKTIVDCINSNPRMFRPMKLVIQDVPVSHNVLHDRYLVFDYGDSNVEAYTLSNSLQGATNKQPLLVTQIGNNAFEKVSAHIQTTLKREDVTTIYNYSEIGTFKNNMVVNKVADQKYLELLNQQNKELKNGKVDQLLKDLKVSNSHEKLATLGYYLANVQDEEAANILDYLALAMAGSKEWIDKLKEYILNCYNRDYPVGYCNTPFMGSLFYDPTTLLGLNYEQIVSANYTHLLEYVTSEGHTFGVYGHFFAAKLLLKLSVKEYVNVIKQLKPKLLSITSDKTITPCYKVMVVLMAELIEYDYLMKCDDVKRVLMADNEEWCRGVGTLILLQKSKDEELCLDDFRNYLKCDDELVALCHSAWCMKPTSAHVNVFYRWLIDTFKHKGDSAYFFKKLVGEILGETHFIEDKVEYMQQVTKPLIDDGFLDKDEVSKIMIESLYDKCINGKHSIIMRDVLPECLFIVDGDISLLYEKVERTVNSMESKILKIAVKSDDNIFEAASECIELRVILIHLIEKYKEKTSEVIEKIKLMLIELDQTLDGYGLERTKRTFENLK